MSDHERRLERLERNLSPARTVYLWSFAGESDKPIAERFPEGVPDDVQVCVVT